MFALRWAQVGAISCITAGCMVIVHVLHLVQSKPGADECVWEHLRRCTCCSGSRTGVFLSATWCEVAEANR